MELTVFVAWDTAIQASSWGVRFLMLSLELFIDTILMALVLTQTEMSNRSISLGSKGGRCVQLTTLPPRCAKCLEFWKPQPPGKLEACPGL
jgi:hypothetical protein